MPKRLLAGLPKKHRPVVFGFDRHQGEADSNRTGAIDAVAETNNQSLGRLQAEPTSEIYLVDAVADAIDVGFGLHSRRYFRCSGLHVHIKSKPNRERYLPGIGSQAWRRRSGDLFDLWSIGFGRWGACRFFGF